MAELQRDYVEQLEALDAERYEAQTRLAQVLGWGDFRECGAAQTEEFAEWAKEVGLPHLGNPHIRKELFGGRPGVGPSDSPRSDLRRDLLLLADETYDEGLAVRLREVASRV